MLGGPGIQGRTANSRPLSRIKISDRSVFQLVLVLVLFGLGEGKLAWFLL